MPVFGQILAAEPAVQVHVAGAVMAIAVTPFALFRRRRDRVHKVLGYVWITAMFVTAVSSFWIHGFRLVGPFSPIHILSVMTLVGLYSGLRLAIRREIAAHRAVMQSIAYWALGIAGLLSFLPGRLMSDMVFGDFAWPGFLVLVAIWLGIGYGTRQRQRASGRARNS